MTDPHFHEEHVVEREVVRPVERRVVTETEVGGPAGANVAALLLAAALALLILVLVVVYLL